MKITYNHYYGSQEKHDLNCYRVDLTCEPHEEAIALEGGWLLYNNSWYQSRSTRIKLSDYKYRKKLPQNYRIEITRSHDCYDMCKQLYDQYISERGYSDLYELLSGLDRAAWILLYRDNTLVAFSKMNIYVGGVETQFNAYLDIPEKLSIGLDMIDYEVDFARSLGVEYLYIGTGTENSSVYKAKLSGFEWWTGAEWSNKTHDYIKLCKRDSEINNLQQLSHAEKT